MSILSVVRRGGRQRHETAKRRPHSDAHMLEEFARHDHGGCGWHSSGGLVGEIAALTCVTVLQTRTSSTRLPGKALLPVADIPMFVLAARRAANTGRELVVVTSADSSDDALAGCARRNQLTCFRGSLDDVLERFVQALVGHDDATIVCRVTADNVFPDGQLLDEMERDFLARRLDYLTSSDSTSGLPYGMSAEFTYLRHLRTACVESSDPYDRQHVMPAVARRFGRRVFQGYAHAGRAQDRCTVDCLDDYLRVVRVFSGVEDPVRVPALDLVGRLAALEDAPIVNRPVRELILGGAQLGMRSGAADFSRAPLIREREALIKTAIMNGASYIDTARAYGDCEEAVGRVFAQGWIGRAGVVTTLALVGEDLDQGSVAALVDASVFQSCVALRTSQLDALLLQRAQHLAAWGGAAWRRLLSLRDSGLIGLLGVCVQTPAQLADALANPDVRWLQLPFNILDHRWSSIVPLLESARAQRPLTVHVHSALLGGLLPTSDAALWHRANFTDSQQVVDWLRRTAREYARANIVDLCLAYVRAQPWVDGIVLGVDNVAQLRENLLYFCSPPLEPDVLRRIALDRPVLPDSVLDTSKRKWDVP